METRVAVIAIIANGNESAHEVNRILHGYEEYIMGRMGLPYRQKNLFIINIVLDGPADKINALAGSLGRISGVTAKAVYPNVKEQEKGAASL